MMDARILTLDNFKLCILLRRCGSRTCVNSWVLSKAELHAKGIRGKDRHKGWNEDVRMCKVQDSSLDGLRR